MKLLIAVLMALYVLESSPTLLGTRAAHSRNHVTGTLAVHRETMTMRSMREHNGKRNTNERSLTGLKEEKEIAMVTGKVVKILAKPSSRRRMNF